jgi:hypothetical protein
VVKNIGRTVARNVQISFDKPLESAQWKERGFQEVAMFRDGLANLAPNQHIRVHFDVFPQRIETGLPMAYAATVQYDDQNGRRLPAETFVLDLATFADTAQTPKDLHDLVDEMERIRREVSKWTDGSRGVRVSSVDADRRRRREMRQIRAERVLASRHDGGWRGVLTTAWAEVRRTIRRYST